MIYESKRVVLALIVIDFLLWTCLMLLCALCYLLLHEILGFLLPRETFGRYTQSVFILLASRSVKLAQEPRLLGSYLAL